MQPSRLMALGVILAALLLGCDDGEDAGPTPAAENPAAGAADRADATTRPAATTLPAAAAMPEDLTIDAERDPRIRERARELGAITVAQMKTLKPGDEVVVLVRGDRGGGTIYGSGPYTLDSQLRKAVLHHGALADNELGLVRVKVLKHDGAHPSVPANGITPTAWGPYHTSYTIEKIDVP